MNINKVAVTTSNVGVAVLILSQVYTLGIKVYKDKMGNQTVRGQIKLTRKKFLNTFKK